MTAVLIHGSTWKNDLLIPHTYMCDLDGSNLKRGEIALLISAVSFVATAAGFDVSLQSQGIHK
jgi:hypothetical protein